MNPATITVIESVLRADDSIEPGHIELILSVARHGNGLRVRDVSRLLGVSRATVWRRVRDGRLARFGRRFTAVSVAEQMKGVA